MHAVVIAIGNPLRADDGVALRVLDLMGPLGDGVAVWRAQQLTPELAAGLPVEGLAIFIDADGEVAAPSAVRIEPQARGTGILSHWMSPEALVLLAQRLYGFRGEAWLCRAVARDFTLGGSITHEAESAAHACARLARELLEGRCTEPKLVAPLPAS